MRDACVNQRALVTMDLPPVSHRPLVPGGARGRCGRERDLRSHHFDARASNG